VQERPIDNAGPSHTQSQKDAFILQILCSTHPELLNSSPYSTPHSLSFWLTRALVASSMRTNVGQPRW
jgi:hypothetical protein